MTIGAAGLQLISQGRLIDEDIHANGDHNGDQEAPVCLGSREQLVHKQLGVGHSVEGGLVNVAAFGVFHHVFEIAHIEGPGDNIGCQPVGHNAGQNLVDVQKCLQRTGNRAPQSTCQNAAQKGQNPDEPGRNGRAGDSQRNHQGGQRAHEILAGSTDVKQTRLVGNGHGKAGHNQRGGPEKHIAQILGVVAPGQLTRPVSAGGEDTGKYQANAVPDAGIGNGALRQAHNDYHQGTNQKADQNGQQRCQNRFGGVFVPQRFNGLLHGQASPFSAFVFRLAPAI